MYYCSDCGCEFETAEVYKETHGFLYPPFEERSCCPNCKSENIRLKNISHCRCCGAKLNGKKEYCSETCRTKGEAMWKAERKKRKLGRTSPLNRIVLETEEYNKKHRTSYSYGQYVALIMPKLKKGKLK